MHWGMRDWGFMLGHDTLGHDTVRSDTMGLDTLRHDTLGLDTGMIRWSLIHGPDLFRIGILWDDIKINEVDDYG